jgi:hypothetical protein
MPRQIHVTISKESQKQCWRIAKARAEPTTWQDVAREAIEIGLSQITAPKKKGTPHAQNPG